MTADIGPDLPLSHAVALGMLHGPTELLPISSSAHTTLVPWLAGWPYTRLDPKLRKSFEVALHAGAAAALLTRPRVIGKGGRASFLLPALAPAALTGYALGGTIERRLGTPATIAAGLLAGSIAMVASELRGGRRAATDADMYDGLALGVAQSLALIPGVSRNGATFAVARARGFSPPDADTLSWSVGLPVIAGAALLKGGQLAREGAPRELALPLAVGVTSAFFSTLASAAVLNKNRRVRLLPACATYRGVLAMYAIRRMRDNTT